MIAVLGTCFRIHNKKLPLTKCPHRNHFIPHPLFAYGNNQAPPPPDILPPQTIP